MGPKILVVQTAFLGDVVLTTPLFRGVKRIHPDAHLAALVTPEAAPLVEADPHLNLILTYDKKRREPMAEVLRKVRSFGFDALLSPHRSHRSAMLALLSGVPLRVGYRDASWSWAYNRGVERPRGAHEVDRVLALLRGLGHEPLEADRVLHVGYTEEEREAVDALLVAGGVAAGERVAGLSPGSIWPTKRWPAERFAAVGRGLAGQGYRVVLLGGPGDAAVAREVEEAFGDRGAVVNVAGKTSLKALAVWMDRLDVLVTNDSAPLHVAAARGTPAVAVFGPTTTALGFGPFHAASRVAEAAVDCRPCGRHGGKHCRRRHFRCMLEVSPEQVLAAVSEVLGDRA